MSIAWRTFSLEEWDAFSLPGWDTFTLDPDTTLSLLDGGGIIFDPDRAGSIADAAFEGVIFQESHGY